MFSNKASESRPAQAESAPGKGSEITRGLSVVGDMDGDGDVRLDGRLEGNVRCRALMIGETGELVGRVDAQEVTVLGTVRGDIHAVQVKLESSAKVSGDVVHEVLEVAAGAQVAGRYSRATDKRRKETAGAGVAATTETPPRVPTRSRPRAGNGQGAHPAALSGSGSGEARAPAKPDA